MKDFKFDYDKENDDLFIYLEGKKSNGAIEVGDFVFDFDKNEELVAIEVVEASDVLSKLISKVISLTEIKSIQAEIIKFRNMDAINIQVQLEDRKEKVPIVIPNIKRRSPVLEF
jgi:uncharacterized protein YuzE